jgi:hypothetical protein
MLQIEKNYLELKEVLKEEMKNWKDRKALIKFL